MKAPLSWLREYVDRRRVGGTRSRARLAVSSLEVERVLDAGVPDTDGNLGRFLVGRVLEAGRHPNADKLRVCQVDVGEGDARQIVCGAWNFEAGATVAVALPGAQLPTLDRPLGEVQLRGQASRGMILAEDEVGLGDDHAGIMRAARRARARCAARGRAPDRRPRPRRPADDESRRPALHGRPRAGGRRPSGR